jgi:GT2 family glycosyltransferase
MHPAPSLAAIDLNRALHPMISFWSHFRQLLGRRPGPALQAAYWQLTRRRVRARNTLRDGTKGTDLAYDIWLKAQAEQDEASGGRLAPEAVPTFSILVHGDPFSPEWQRSSRSAESQTGTSGKVQVIGGADLATLLAQATGDFVFFLRCGDELASSALAQIGRALAAGASDVAYADEDHPQPGRRSRVPWFKPDWNSELFFGLDYLSSAVAVRTTLARRVAADMPSPPPLTLDALLLQVTQEATGPILHLPAILVHVGEHDGAPLARLSAVSSFLEDRAVCTPGPFGTVRVQWPLPDPLPSVSVVIPTKDKVELLRACADGLLTRTAYPALDILIVDNGSREKEALDYLDALDARPDVRVLRCDAEYNYSALNNLAVREATGAFVLLLNNDTEVIGPDWLCEMMRYAVRDEVGAVGAKLLYSDGSIQHAGVVVGMGEAAGHAHRHLAPGEPGYFRQPQVAHFATAVTGACLLVQRRKYEAVGGLDEQSFAIAYNDVDFCLKLEQAGWRNVYTPHAILYHHESKSRGSDLSPQHRQRYMRELANLQERWGTKTFADPLHSVHLDRYSETYLPNLG